MPALQKPRSPERMVWSTCRAEKANLDCKGPGLPSPWAEGYLFKKTSFFQINQLTKPKRKAVLKRASVIIYVF